MSEDDSEELIRGEVRLADYTRVSHGLYMKKRDDLDARGSFVRELKAHLLLLPDSAVFTHLTAARILGWQLPKLPDQVPVFVAVAQKDPRPRRAGLICSRLLGPPGQDPPSPEATPGVPKTQLTRWVPGLELPVEWPELVLLRAARDLSLLDLIILTDSARRLGHVDESRMGELLATSRPGVRQLRRAWQLSHPGAESAGETLLRAFHVVMDVPVTPQVELRDDEGRLLGRADLLVNGTTQVHEYDGAHHRDKAQHRTDLRRERGWAGSPYVRRGFVLDDLLNHPTVMMHELDRLLHRPHALRRLRRWRAMVDDSLYSDPGRDRVMNRWRRRTTLPNWSLTA